MPQPVIYDDILILAEHPFRGWQRVEPDWQPDDPYKVRVELVLLIGIPEQPGYDTFYAMVSTPSGVLSAEEHDALPRWIERGKLLIRRWHWSELRAFLEATVSSCRGPTAEDAMAVVRGYFRWEYDGLPDRWGVGRV